MIYSRLWSIFLLAVLGNPFVFPRHSRADDWPMWGRDQTRNMVSREKNPPTDWQVEVKDEQGKVVKPARNIKWSAPIGSRCANGLVVANGLVWVGTNNDSPRDPKLKKDASVLMCFREGDGKFLWQYVVPRMLMPNDAITGSMGVPTIVGDQLWLITNRWEVVCFDISSLRRNGGEPRLLWKVDMPQEFKVYTHAPLMASGFAPSLAAPHKDLIYAVTGNGVEEDRVTLPTPKAPSLVCLNAKTGKTVWQDGSPGRDIMHCQLSSPLIIEVKGKSQVVIGQGDGWLRSFEAETGKLIWKCELNPKGAKFELGGRGVRNYILATPVYHDNRIYIAPGQDPSHGEGMGGIYCIDPTKEGDVSKDLLVDGQAKPNPNSGVVWFFGGPASKQDARKLNRDWYFDRTQSTVAVQNGLVFAAELAGYFHCFDAKTGKQYWVHDAPAGITGSPLWIDDKIYLPADDGVVWVYSHGKELKPPKKLDMNSSIRTPPVFANGVLYVATESTVYAIQEKK